MRVGVLEENGHQNYRRWSEMKSYHPCNGASWLETTDGLFTLDDSFYQKSGGIFDRSNHYDLLVKS
jgi:hypothetical protein